MSIEIGDYHQAIIDALKAQFAGRVQTVEMYELTEEKPINTPAILLEMEYGDEGYDKGDDLVPLQCRMTLHMLIGSKTPNLQMEIRRFAFEVFRLVRSNQFDVSDVTMPEGINMGPGEFKVGEKGYESWYVSWEQTIYAGESAWEPTGFVPQSVFVGRNPEISQDTHTYEQAV